MDDNDVTLQSYEDSVDDYVAINKQAVEEGEYKDWLDRSLAMVKPGGMVLELGSAYGRDAAYIKGAGYDILTTDAVQGFVNILLQRGFKAQLLNALNDPMGGPYDMIFANAVFLHFNQEKLRQVLLKVRGSLKPGGVLAFSVKEGSGSEWIHMRPDTPRYFCYWKQADLRQMVEKAGFKVEEDSSRQGSQDQWLHVIATK